MMSKFILILIALFSVHTHFLSAQNMNNEKLEVIIKQVSDSIQGQSGYWQFKYYDKYILVITDEVHNRMRIVSPIVEQEKLDAEYYKKCLEANYHSALDVKYALAEGLLWSVFIHPLKELTDNQVKDAIKQVYTAASTFGYSYSSTDLVFGSSTGN